MVFYELLSNTVWFRSCYYFIPYTVYDPSNSGNWLMTIRVYAAKPGYGACYFFIGPLFTPTTISVIPFSFKLKFPVLI